MADDAEEPTQRTPKGSEIPVPKKADVLADLRKVAKGGAPRPAGRDDPAT